MAYLHCNNCDFSQDDFWSESYNPMKSVLDWENNLLNQDIEEPFSSDSWFNETYGNPSRREMLAREFEKQARRIRQMKYRTFEEYKQMNPERICPNCGEKQLDID